MACSMNARVPIGLVLLAIASTACLPGRSHPSRPQIGSGVAHTCLLSVDGRVTCWGQGANPEATPDAFARPVEIPGWSSGVRAIGIGWYHACAALSDGRVECWGRNESGQLGDGTRVDSFLPVRVEGVGAVVALTAGAAHTCAQTEGGEVHCWGSNSGGQLGDGSTEDRPSPAQVLDLDEPMTEVVAGSAFTCGLTDQGRVLCWGEFPFLPDSGPAHPVPVPIPGLPADIEELAPGDYHLCLRTSAGNVSCIGSIFTAEDPAAGPPFDLTGLAGQVDDILAGADFACAATAKRFAACWGDNYFGQLGDLAPAGRTPTWVPGLSQVTRLGGGHYTACALAADGGVTCWGDTSFGQLGDGSARWK